MLDLFGIMFSSLMMLMVIIRAVQQDRAQPWFQKVTRKEAPVPSEKQVWKPKSL